MKQWTLLMTLHNTPQPAVEMEFATPYDAREWLRQLSYTYQSLDAKTLITESMVKSLLEICRKGEDLPMITFLLTEQE